MLADGTEPTLHLARDVLLLLLRVWRSEEESVPSHDSRKDKNGVNINIREASDTGGDLVTAKLIYRLI